VTAPAADREIVLAPETSAFEQAKAIVRYCAGLGYPLTLADFNKLAFAEDHALMRWIKSELSADRPAFLDRYRHDNQEDTNNAIEETEEDATAQAARDQAARTVYSGGARRRSERADAALHQGDGGIDHGGAGGAAVRRAGHGDVGAGVRRGVRGAARTGHERSAGDLMAPKKPTKDPKPKKPKEKGAKGDVKIEHFQQPMPCALSPEEVIDRGNKVMKLLSDKEMKQADIKSVTAHLKADIKQIDADIAKLSKEHTEKRCYRSVEIRREYRYRVGSVVDIRTDLDDVINERPLTGTERQLEDERLSKAPAKPKAANDEEAPDQPGSDEPPESGERADEDEDSEASAE
jgi:hypothetical protein